MAKKLMFSLQVAQTLPPLFVAGALLPIAGAYPGSCKKAGPCFQLRPSYSPLLDRLPLAKVPEHHHDQGGRLVGALEVP